MIDKDQFANNHRFFLSTLERAGYSQEECEAISRGMTVSSFRGEMPRGKQLAQQQLLATAAQLFVPLL
jgi:hypothetical protein